MDRFATEFRRNMAIAVAAGVGTNTVRNYFRGEGLQVRKRDAIERACVLLGVPLLGETKPRARGKKGGAA